MKDIKEYLKELKQEHTQEMLRADNECEDEIANYEQGYIDCLKDILRYIEKGGF